MQPNLFEPSRPRSPAQTSIVVASLLLLAACVIRFWAVRYYSYTDPTDVGNALADIAWFFGYVAVAVAAVGLHALLRDGKPESRP